MRIGSKLLTAVVTCTAMSMAAVISIAVSATASTTDVLTYGSLGGSNVAVNSTLTSQLASGTDATFQTAPGGTEGVSCSSSTMTQTVSTNPAASGTADLSTTGLTFSNCTTNIDWAYDINASQVAYLPYSSSVDDQLSNPMSVDGVLVRFNFDTMDGPQECDYQDLSMSGTLSFSNQDFTLYQSGYGEGQICPSDMYASAKYDSIKDTSVSGSPSVYMN